MSSEVKTTQQKQYKLLDISTVVDELWKGLLRLWWLILLLASIGASLTYFQARRSYSPVYSAYSTFIVSSQATVTYSDSYNQSVATQIGTVIPYILSSEAFQKMVADDLGMDAMPGSVSAEVMEGTNLITIRSTSYTPDLAYQLLTSALKNYPEVAGYVLGDIKMTAMDESGAPSSPDNMPAFQGQAKRGLMIGAFLALLLIVIYALTRNTIHKEEDLKKILNVKCLGVLPEARFKKRGKVKNPLVLLDNPGIPSAYVEAIRTVRTRLERAMKEEGLKSFFVTSALPGEGKSTVSANLAMALTRRGYSVILVDGDLRNPSVRKALDMEQAEFGASEVLKEIIPFEKALVPYKDTKLKVLMGGKHVSNTARLLNTRFAALLIRNLEKKADFVLVDTPPSGIMSDAAMIAQYVRGGVFVVKQDYAQIDRIMEGIEMFSASNAKIMGCVLNHAVAGVTGYGYGYGYGYGRYGYGYGSSRYGYGYGHKKGEEKEEKQDNA